MIVFSKHKKNSFTISKTKEFSESSSRHYLFIPIHKKNNVKMFRNYKNVLKKPGFILVECH